MSKEIHLCKQEMTEEEKEQYFQHQQWNMRRMIKLLSKEDKQLTKSEEDYVARNEMYWKAMKKNNK